MHFPAKLFRNQHTPGWCRTSIFGARSEFTGPIGNAKRRTMLQLFARRHSPDHATQEGYSFSDEIQRVDDGALAYSLQDMKLSLKKFIDNTYPWKARTILMPDSFDTFQRYSIDGETYRAGTVYLELETFTESIVSCCSTFFKEFHTSISKR